MAILQERMFRFPLRQSIGGVCVSECVFVIFCVQGLLKRQGAVVDITSASAELVDLTSLPAIRLQFKLKGTSYQHFFSRISFINYTQPKSKKNNIGQQKPRMLLLYIHPIFITKYRHLIQLYRQRKTEIFFRFCGMLSQD